MRVVVTGATGFVGAPIVRALLARGDELTILSRDAARARKTFATHALPDSDGSIADGSPYRAAVSASDVSSSFEAITANIEEPGDWQKSLTSADAVLHLAGESIAGKKWDARQKQIIRDTRVESTRHIVETIATMPAEQRPHTLVTSSGIDYYGFASTRGDDFDDDPVAENDPPGTSFLARLCRDWEKEALVAREHGVRVACMRCGIVLGPPGGALDKMTAPFRSFVGGRISSGYQFMSWIHRDDAVAGYLAALTDDRYTGGINLVTESTRNRDFSKALGKALGKPSWLPVPAFAVKIAAGEFAEYVLNGRNAVPAKLRELGFAWAHPTLESALVDVK